MTLAQIKTSRLISDLNLQNLPGKRKQEIYSKILQHFGRFILVATLGYLNEEQFSRFKKYLKDSNSEAEIKALCAEVPGLAEFLEARVEQEYNLLKSFIKTNA